MLPCVIIGLAGGAAAGYGLYRFIGCHSGTCPITANPYTSIIFGMVLGILLVCGR